MFELLLLLIFVYLIAGLGEIYFWETREQKKVIVYSLLSLAAFTLSALIVLGVDVPSPALIIEDLVVLVFPREG